MTTVEFEDVSDLHTMIDAAKPMLSLPAEATAEEVYINGFEVVLQQITKSFSSNATKAEYLRLAVLRDIDFKTGETEEMYNLAHRVGASYLMHGKIKDAEETLLYALGGLNKIHDQGRMTLWGNKDFMFAVAGPFDEKEASNGNGTMLGFHVDSTEEVDRLHKKALDLGSLSEGEPRMRSNMHSAYVRDLDQNKICFYTSNA